MSFIEEEFRIQEPESRIDSVRPDEESRFKTPDFKTLARGACRRQDSLSASLSWRRKNSFLAETPDLTAGVFLILLA
ncbi:hypothetical protein [Nostoc sp. ATCC 53789]|uniref:hypothetical protein n=1 Tax=Nostoc sp. ATCC 53789 TaxID=76335 RepID=UPI000DEC1331|nr:hypothetical protein [Nostoc sp. ATCC 53789]RCJ20871.1 hypothetical protein A6V25_05850 [Nostoc sp. ATCC 53789]